MEAYGKEKGTRGRRGCVVCLLLLDACFLGCGNSDFLLAVAQITPWQGECPLEKKNCFVEVSSICGHFQGLGHSLNKLVGCLGFSGFHHLAKGEIGLMLGIPEEQVGDPALWGTFPSLTHPGPPLPCDARSAEERGVSRNSFPQGGKRWKDHQRKNLCREWGS